MKNIQNLIDSYVLDEIELSELPEYGIWLIEDWYSSESLYILSWLDKENWEEIRLYFKKTVIELGYEFREYWEIVIERIISEIHNWIEKGTKYYNYLDWLNVEDLFNIINHILIIDSSDKVISTLAVWPFENFAIYSNLENYWRVIKYYDLFKNYALNNKSFLKFLYWINEYTYCREEDKKIIWKIIKEVEIIKWE